MKVFLITYDLKRPLSNYAGMFKLLQDPTIKWWHYLDSTWLVAVPQIHSPKSIFDLLKPFLDQNDHILIIEVKANYWGWLPEEAWAWIQENVRN